MSKGAATGAGASAGKVYRGRSEVESREGRERRGWKADSDNLLVVGRRREPRVDPAVLLVLAAPPEHLFQRVKEWGNRGRGRFVLGHLSGRIPRPQWK